MSTTSPQVVRPSARPGPGGWFGFRTPTLGFVYAWAIADLAANVLLVVTGGAVRLTGSGLGCSAATENTPRR